MLKPDEFEKVVEDLLFIYRQLLLNGYLHKRVNNIAYNKNVYTWNSILLSLERGIILGLARHIERKYFGEFSDNELKIIAGKITDIRNHFAHINLGEILNGEKFFEQNGLHGSDIIRVIEALKNQYIQNEKNIGAKIKVQELFNETTRSTMDDLDSWLKSFNSLL